MTTQMDALVRAAFGLEAPDQEQAQQSAATPDPEAQDDACPICLESLSETGATMLTTSCGHQFCASCLRAATTRSAACPLCRDFVHTCESLRPAACGLCRAGIQLGKKDSARNRERDRREDRLMKGYLVSVAHAPNAPATRAERARHAHL